MNFLLTKRHKHIDGEWKGAVSKQMLEQHFVKKKVLFLPWPITDILKSYFLTGL